jgi:beta-lactamase superfamily II metal-dependent hydrolase
LVLKKGARQDQVIDAFHGNYSSQGLYKKMRDMHPYLVEIEEIATKRDIEIRDVFQEAQIGSHFTVLAPNRERYINLIPELDKTPEARRPIISAAKTLLGEAVEKVAKWADEDWHIETLSNDPDPPTSASNELCIVQLGQFDNKKILLTADIGPAGLNEAADYAETLGVLTPPDFVQVPHHGSRKNVTPDVLNRWLGPIAPKGTKRGTAFVSVGKEKSDRHRARYKILSRSLTNLLG